MLRTLESAAPNSHRAPAAHHSRTAAIWLLATALVAVGACGGGTEGPSSATPTVHLLSQGNQTVSVGQGLAFGPFTVPEGATVTFSIVDQPTGIGSDTIHAGIVVDSTLAASNPTTFGYQEGSSIQATTPALPAGAYDFAITCHNISDPCIFGQTLTALY